MNREISVYDLLNTCTNLVDGKPCGERGEFTDVCPKCGNTDKTKFIRGYGTDTHIFISAENYASKITVDGDEASVKNCFKVTGGDDFMTDTIKNCNPAGSEYIYRFSQADYDDMPEQLVEKLQTYFETYNEAEASYQELVRQYYNAETAYSFYKTSMMPRSNSKHWESEHGYNYGDVCYVLTLPSWCYLECSVAGTSGLIEFDATDLQDGDIIQDGTVTWIVRKHIITVPSATQTLNDVIIPYLANNYVYLEDSTTKNAITMKNWVLRLLEAEVNPLFRLEIPTDTTLDWDESGAIKTLTFNITVTNTTDPDDIASTSTDVSPQPLVARCKVSSSREEYIEYMTQLVEKRLTRSDTTFTELWKIDNNNDFKELLTEYSLDMLSNFQQSYAGCIDVLISQGVKDESNDFHGVNLYTEIYDPYNTRIGYIEDEMVRRKVTVDTWDGIRTSLSNQMTEVHNQLDLKTFLKDPTAEDPDWLWHIFFNYLRESDYQNSTYISTGLSDNFLVKDAATVLDKARLELEKASELQYSLSDDLNNLLNTSEFADYKDKFELGDYIVCRVDEENYKLRLINLSYQYSNPESVSVTFANVTKIKNYFSDVQTVLNQATAMSSSYDITLHQVDKNNTTTAQVTTWNAEGLNSALTRIKNNNMEEVTYDTNGITLKEYDVTYDPLNTDENNYSNKQLRLTHDMIAFTKDNWIHASLALGENQYEYYDSNHVRKTDTDYGLIAKFVDAGYIHGSQIISGEIYSEDYTSATGTFIDLKNNTITFGGDKLTFDPTNGLSIKGAIHSTSGDIAGFTIESNNIHKGVTSINDSDTTHVGVYVGTDGIRNQNGATHVTISGGDIKGKQNWGEYSIDALGLKMTTTLSGTTPKIELSDSSNNETRIIPNNIKLTNSITGHAVEANMTADTTGVVVDKVVTATRFRTTSVQTTSADANGVIYYQMGLPDEENYLFVKSGSSIRFKHDFKTQYNKELDPHNLYDIKVYQYKYQTNYLSNKKDIRYDTDVIGFIAEEIDKHYPIAVDKYYDPEKDKTIATDWNSKYIIPPMLKLIQEQKEEIETLKQEVEKLKEVTNG